MTVFDYPWYALLIAAFIAAIWQWPKYKNTSQKYFLFFLAYIIVHEVAGYISGEVLEQQNISNLIYNIFIVISFLFYMYWYRLILQNKKLVNICVLVLIIAIVYSCLVDGLSERIWDIPVYVGAIAILLCSVMYFSSLLQNREVVHFYKLQVFWIATGVLVFYVGIIPWFFFEELKESSKEFYLTSLNVLLYLCFFISFLCLNKK